MGVYRISEFEKKNWLAVFESTQHATNTFQSVIVYGSLSTRPWHQASPPDHGPHNAWPHLFANRYCDVP